MSERPCTTVRQGLVLFLVLGLLVSSSGCIGGLAQLLYVIKGHKSPPEYPGLAKKRVAVVCVSDASAYGPDTLSYTVSKYVSIKLANNEEDITLVPPAEIEEYLDLNGWDESQLVDLGSNVKADMVVVVEVGAYSIHEGATLFKGRSDLTVKVFDIQKKGQQVYERGPEEFVFPENGRPSLQTSERQFEAFYLARLTDHITNLFLEHDKLDSFADDAMFN